MKQVSRFQVTPSQAHLHAVLFSPVFAFHLLAALKAKVCWLLFGVWEEPTFKALSNCLSVCDVAALLTSHWEKLAWGLRLTTLMYSETVLSCSFCRATRTCSKRSKSPSLALQCLRCHNTQQNEALNAARLHSGLLIDGCHSRLEGKVSNERHIIHVAIGSQDFGVSRYVSPLHLLHDWWCQSSAFWPDSERGLASSTRLSFQECGQFLR